MSETMTTGKKWLIALMAIFTIAFVGVLFWYGYVIHNSPEKVTTDTFYGNVLETDKGDKKYIIELDYNTNANKNGLEKFDVKFNYFMDETKTNIFSQGVQYVANTPNGKIDWMSYDKLANMDLTGVNNMVDYLKLVNEKAGSLNEVVTTSYDVLHTGWWIFGDTYTAQYYSPFVDATQATKYNYQSFDDFGTIGSTNPISDNTYFTITMGEQMMYMKFTGDNYASFKTVEEFKDDSRHIATTGYTHVYNYYSIDYMAMSLYDSIQKLPAGTNGTYVLEFGNDVFKYYKVNEDKSVGEEIQGIDRDNVIKNFKSYYTIKVNISADGARNAKDSIFGVLHGSSNYTLDGSTDEAGQYFTGEQVITITNSAFDLVQIIDNCYALKLKQTFIDQYKPYAKTLTFKIEIDKAALSQQGKIVESFTKDSGLEQFKIVSSNVPGGEIC